MDEHRLLAGKTLLAGTIDGYHLRSMLLTGILPALKEMGCRIICLYPYPEASMLDRYKKAGIEFKGIDVSRPGVFEWLLLVSHAAIFRRLVPDQNLLADRVNVRKIKKFVAVFAGTLFKSRQAFNITGKFIRKYSSKKEVKDFFDKTKIDLFLSGTPGWKYPELPYLREAEKRNIPIICQILSWDNLSMKGPFFIKPDKLMLWNEHMKRQAVDNFGYEEKEVFITGAPQFDVYRNMEIPREEAKRGLMDYLGIDRRRYRKIITFAGIPRGLAPFQKEVLYFLQDIVHNTSGLHDVAVVFRPHPQDDIRLDSFFSDVKSIYINNPSEYLNIKASDNAYRWKPACDSLNELALVMRGSDVVITIASSMSLDAAAVDTPVINLAFDISGQVDKNLLRDYYESPHYRLITYSDAVAIVRNRDELIGEIKLALTNPSLRGKERRRLVETICGRKDKIAADAQVEIIMNQLLKL